MYTVKNYKSKAAIKRDLKEGVIIRCWSKGIYPAPTQGLIELEGPHYPEAHKWYGTGIMKDGVLVELEGVKLKDV